MWRELNMHTHTWIGETWPCSESVWMCERENEPCCVCGRSLRQAERLKCFIQPAVSFSFFLSLYRSSFLFLSLSRAHTHTFFPLMSWYSLFTLEHRPPLPLSSNLKHRARPSIFGPRKREKKVDWEHSSDQLTNSDLFLEFVSKSMECRSCPSRL